MLGKRASKPDRADWQAIKHLAKYISATEDLCLKWYRDLSASESELKMYVDSDWGGDLNTRRSTTGFIGMYAGAPVCWSSKRQPLVAMSSMEAELIALCAASLMTVYMRGLAEDMSIPVDGPTTVLEDNQSCIAVAESEMQTKRQAHIPRRYFKVRELIQGQDPEIKLQYVKSADNYADCCTKNLGPEILSGIRGHILARRSDVG